MSDNYEKSFRSRWSEGLQKDGFTLIANAFLRNYYRIGITIEEAMFIIHCFEYKWTVRSPYPSLKTISKEMGMSRNTVQRYARSLENKGYLKRIMQKGAPSEINLEPLIKTLEQVPYLNLNIIQKCTEHHPNLDTKEEPIRKNNSNIKIFSGMESIKTVIENR